MVLKKNIVYTYIQMEILYRNGSEVILKDRNGRVWLTRRVKRKKHKRQKIYGKRMTVRFIPIVELDNETRRVYTEKTSTKKKNVTPNQDNLYSTI